MSAPKVEHLTPEMMGELAEFWRKAFPLLPMNGPLLRERIFGPEDAAPERSLIYRAEDGAIIALSVLVPPDPSSERDEPGWCGFRAFGVHPEHRKRGLAKALLDESLSLLGTMGGTVATMLATPPFYLQPGVDTRQTDFVIWLIRNGFEHVRTNFNMTVALGSLRLPTLDEICRPDAAGFSVRRASADDLPAFRKHCTSEWTYNWMREASQGAKHEPSSLFLAEKEGEVVGFAAYETNQALGCFGPTGVAPAHQGRGLGRRLLYATLIDMKALGRTRCEIGWIGPPEFYYRHAGAKLGPAFWEMKKAL